MQPILSLITLAVLTFGSLTYADHVPRTDLEIALEKAVNAGDAEGFKALFPLGLDLSAEYLHQHWRLENESGIVGAGIFAYTPMAYVISRTIKAKDPVLRSKILALANLILELEPDDTFAMQKSINSPILGGQIPDPITGEMIEHRDSLLEYAVERCDPEVVQFLTENHISIVPEAEPDRQNLGQTLVSRNRLGEPACRQAFDMAWDYIRTEYPKVRFDVGLHKAKVCARNPEVVQLAIAYASAVSAQIPRLADATRELLKDLDCLEIVGEN